MDQMSESVKASFEIVSKPRSRTSSGKISSKKRKNMDPKLVRIDQKRPKFGFGDEILSDSEDSEDEIPGPSEKKPMPSELEDAIIEQIRDADIIKRKLETVVEKLDENANNIE